MCKKGSSRELCFVYLADLLNDLGDQNMTDQLRKSSSKGTHVSTASTNEHLHCLNNHLKVFLNHLISTLDFSLMTDETTDMVDRAKLSKCICYVGSARHKLKKFFWVE